MSVSHAEEIHTFELLGVPPERKTQNGSQRAIFEAMPLRDLGDTLDQMEDYLDSNFVERAVYRWRHGGAPLSRKEYRVALEVCQQRESAERAKRKT